MQHHTHVARTAAALAAAMGIGRFVYTPILPLMTAQAGVSAHTAADLATANYVGYLVGAVAGSISPRLARSPLACRLSLVVLIVSLAAMPLATTAFGWMTLRAIAGAVSALVFVIAVNTMLEHLHSHPAHLAGWGFGGVGAGIALSAVLILAVSDWQAAWWAAAGVAALLCVVAWPIRSAAASAPASVDDDGRPPHGPFSLLLISYTLEGVGYIIAGTFLVAAVGQDAPEWLGGSTWLVVGLATVPSAALWAAMSTRWSHPALLTAALFVQAVGIAAAGVAGGVTAALVGAVLFGGTFVGISTLALAAGRMLRYPRAVALLTAGYSVGQILGPLVVAPTLHHGFRPALLVGAVVVSVAALVAGVVRVVVGKPDRGPVETEIADITGEFVDDGTDGGAVVTTSPHQRPRPQR
ncbi:major facilitator family protein transporter [Mycolicibacterium smegmatis MKD8]|uniref:Major facilitator family protein transporter n=1 Tax=Mycolicibacterium smegmatis (strain MKD8) TaxID=1214915 RepID=A0A2U9PZ96_MYCSE|nr:major facilitator family protein transporter [Mycolicibacterium smegmatis MKD8]